MPLLYFWFYALFLYNEIFYQSLIKSFSNQKTKAMAKSMDAKKETKKAPTKSLKEKRAEKKEKKNK